MTAAGKWYVVDFTQQLTRTTADLSLAALSALMYSRPAMSDSIQTEREPIG